jgi:hypothetical protein
MSETQRGRSPDGQRRTGYTRIIARGARPVLHRSDTATPGSRPPQKCDTTDNEPQLLGRAPVPRAQPQSKRTPKRANARQTSMPKKSGCTREAPKRGWFDARRTDVVVQRQGPVHPARRICPTPVDCASVWGGGSATTPPATPGGNYRTRGRGEGEKRHPANAWGNWASPLRETLAQLRLADGVKHPP